MQTRRASARTPFAFASKNILSDFHTHRNVIHLHIFRTCRAPMHGITMLCIARPRDVTLGIFRREREGRSRRKLPARRPASDARRQRGRARPNYRKCLFGRTREQTGGFFSRERAGLRGGETGFRPVSQMSTFLDSPCHRVEFVLT